MHRGLAGVLAVSCAGVSIAASPQARPATEFVELAVERASNVFFARTTINGQGPFWFTVDTGATLTVIDPATAKRVGVTARPAGRRSDVGVGTGATELATAIGVTLETRGLAPLTPELLYVVPVRGNLAYLGHPIDGVIGTDWLRLYEIEFDYGASRVRVRRGPGATPAAAAKGPTTVPIALEGNVLTAPASLAFEDGTSASARLLVDTGSNGELTLTSPYVRRQRLTERFESRLQSLSVGINGATSSSVIVLPSLAFNRAVIEQPKAALSQATTGLHASTAYDGILGAELLRRFTIAIDYPRRLMTLRRP